MPRLKEDVTAFLDCGDMGGNITTDGDFASLLLDCGVPGKTPWTLCMVVWIPTEILLQDAVWLGGVKLPAVGEKR